MESSEQASSAHETLRTGAISRWSFRHLPSVTGKEVLQLSRRFAEPVDAWWEQYLVAGYHSGVVLVVMRSLVESL